MLINKDGIQGLKKPLIIMAGLIVLLFAIETVYIYYAKMPGHFSRGIMDDYNIYLLGGLLAIWLLMLVAYMASGIAYRQAAKDMELHKSTVIMRAVQEKKQEMDEALARIIHEQQENREQSIAMERVAQEITGPLQRILELNRNIRQEAKGNSIDTYTGGVENISRRLLLMMDNIQDMFKLEAGNIELQPEEYSLKAMLEEIYAAHSSREEMQQLLFSCQASSDLPSRLIGDKKRIRQVLDNLLVNSVRYTKKGSVRLTVFGKIHEEKVHLLFSVKDTGVGMADEVLNRLNQDFAGTAVGKGQPLNDVEIALYLSNGILRMMDSKLQAASIHGQGSEFYFEVEQDVTYSAPVGRIDFSNECAQQRM